jgi:hypothetical protein
MTPLTERAIRARVPRPLRPLRAGRLAHARGHPLDRPAPRHAHWSRLATESDGYVIRRFDLAGNDLPSYVRFDTPVQPDLRERKRTKYVYPAASRVTSSKVLDVHPLVADRLRRNTTHPIFLCLEGCFKADALAGTGRLAISVPSVTMWELDEDTLAPWLPVLRQAPVVYVMTDSDYLRTPEAEWHDEPGFINRQVRIQTDRAAGFFHHHGVKTVRLVPPYLSAPLARAFGLERTSRKIGIDDLIRIGGNLRRWDKADNPLGVHTVRGEPVVPHVNPRSTRRQGRDQSADRDRTFLRWLGRYYADNEGLGLFSVEDAKRDLGWSQQRVYEARKSCEARGLLRVWPGRPLGPGRGNSAHAFAFQLHAEA